MLSPRVPVIILVTLISGLRADAQRFLSNYDSSIFAKDTLGPLVSRMKNLHFIAYIQPQFQVASRKGINSFAGGDFASHSNNRFMLRRARLKIDYRLPGKKGHFPAAVFTFQFEATERDVNVRDMFVKIFEPSKNKFSLTAGLFARPFGYEINLSSSVRETPERGRMSQTLMPSERDLGAMISYESRNKSKEGPRFKIDFGVLNGQGKSVPREFDSYKDLIGRLSLKPLNITEGLAISGGISILHGGWAQATKYRYEMGSQNGNSVFVVDSSLSNTGKKAPRHYYGADLQVLKNHGWGRTEIRGEYWRGLQPGTFSSTENPGELPLEPTYIRNFEGAFIYFIQNIINDKWELVFKYDWYDPNTMVRGIEIGRMGTNLSEADIKYSTLGAGFTHHFNENLKMLVYYDLVKNESTALDGFRTDKKDNVFTWRIQMRF